MMAATRGTNGLDAEAASPCDGRPRTARHPLFARFYHFLTLLSEPRFLREARAVVASDLAGRILEIGAGNGANLPYYSAQADLTLVEPEKYLLDRAAERARALGRPVKFCLARAESLPFCDASFDAVVSTMVLCSVDCPVRALKEIARVLRPGGVFRFIEHVRSGSPRAAWLQDLITPAWRRIGGNCHLNRPTPELMRTVGFAIYRVEVIREGKLLPVVAGEARRKAL